MTAPRTQPTVAERARTSYNALLPVVYPTRSGVEHYVDRRVTNYVRPATMCRLS